MLRNTFEQPSSNSDRFLHSLSDPWQPFAEISSMRPSLYEAVLNALRSSAHFALRHIDVTAEGRHISLNGLVPSYYLKQCAQVTVQKVEGVQTVHNTLSVSSGTTCRRW